MPAIYPSISSGNYTIPVLFLTDETRGYLQRNKVSISDRNSLSTMFKKLSINDLANCVITDKILNMEIGNIEFSESFDIDWLVTITGYPQVEQNVIRSVNAIANTNASYNECLEFLKDKIYELDDKYFEVLMSSNELIVIIVKKGFLTYLNAVGKFSVLKQIIQLLHTGDDHSRLYSSKLYLEYLTHLKMNVN